MNIRPREFSIVIVASDFNPTILNSDFLERQEIVPEKWGWKVSGPQFTTPPFAMVTYDSGVAVSVKSNVFQVADGLRNKGPDSSKIPLIARKYIEVLPHVRYTAVGHNFMGFAELGDWEVFLQKRFLKSGVWDSKKYPLKGVSLKFVYPREGGGQVTVALDSAILTDKSGDEPKDLHGIMVQTNYNRDCSGFPSHEQVIAHLEHTNEDWAHFQSTASELLE